MLHVSDPSFLCLETPRCNEVGGPLQESLLDSLQKGISFWEPQVASTWEPRIASAWVGWVARAACFGTMGCFLETDGVLLGLLWTSLGPMLCEGLKALGRR